MDMDNQEAASRHRPWSRWLIPITILTAVLAGLYYLLLRLGRITQQTSRILNLGQFQGLTEAEAAGRRPPTLEEDRDQQTRQVRRQIWRSSTFNIFNMSMIGLAITQTLLGDPLSALLTLAIFVLSVIFNAAQQLYATGQIEKLLDIAQPRATAIRDGHIRSIDVDEIVEGDVLVAGPGDEFLADGQMLHGRIQVIAANQVGYESQTEHKQEGDLIQSGDFCLDGRAVYSVTERPGEPGIMKWTPVQKKTELTPLQRIVSRVLRLMLSIIAIFLIFLVLDTAGVPIWGELFDTVYREAASIFFSIAPSGLFFMIVATYALGSARLGKLGALVRDSRTVESLAQISVLCFSKTGTLTGADLHLNMVPLASGRPALAESRVRQILGDMAHSIQGNNPFLQAIADNLDGSRREFEEAALYFSAYGWSAVSFSEVDNRGTYFIGEPEIMQPHLADEPTSDEGEEENGHSAGRIRKLLGHLGRLIRQDDQEPADESAVALSELRGSSVEDSLSALAAEPENTTNSASEAQNGDLFNSLRLRIQNIIASDQEDDAVSHEGESESADPDLLFAYSPQPTALFDEDGLPRLADGLLPLCTVRIEEKIRPEARKAIEAFTGSGVSVKILSSDDPKPVFRAAEQLGLVDDQSQAGSSVTGFQLAQMVEGEFERKIRQVIVFSQLNSQQKGEIVGTLLRLGERVAMVGDAVGDVSAMTAADLSLTLQNSSQAALSTADIVLLEDSFNMLPDVLKEGQRIVNGMLDILKINLVQIGYILLLMVAMLFTSRRIFYYHPTQGGVVVFLTVIVPSIGLTYWASAGAVPRQYMRSRLLYFVVPASLTMAIAALVISYVFSLGPVNIGYAQLTVAYGLVAMGLLLIIFVQPPSRFWVGGDVLSGDWRSTYMAFALLLLFLLATALPITQELLRLSTLQNLSDYLVIASVVVAWLFIVRAIWRAPWLSRYVGTLSERLEKS